MGTFIYNYKVVAVLRDDLSGEERQFIEEKMSGLMDKMGIIEVEDHVFCKKPPIEEFDDFGPVRFFFHTSL